ncbi:hypothetical protein GYMLUDRAFT_74598 [Collybiopsis luxurians FD-317 M1]|uniref:Uncharacterized protein n=1 Tax=Collybiopsis luxurians FD-317 M1 TaxID=944289 RepID=A0A0D0B7F0_9AGAR|nr:hypothetical protein GYMLUDRAFT_74598 [Collybiopsis luxurians FD-317 M1]
MSIRHAEEAPWPRQTQPPTPHKRSIKRRKIEERQTLQDAISQAENQCDIFSGNNVESCFPTADSTFVQDEFVTFVWNSRLPSYAQTNKVNVYLFHGDSNEQILSLTNLDNSNNQAGVHAFQVDDAWWGTNGPNYSGSNTTYPFYFGITPNTTTFDVSAQTQTHFSVIQTTFPNSILSSLSSASSASSASSLSASRASASSASSASAAASSSSAAATASSGSASGSGSLHPDDTSSGFPHWAIAVIVVLGFLAIASSCLLAFFIMRRLRRRRELESNRNSMGSSSPMMAHVQSPGSPLLPSGAAGAGGAAAAGAGAASLVSPDGASSISHGGSAHGGEGGPFSGADAAIIANAFRTMLRKPDFADAPVEEGDSPDSQERGRVELSRELAEEGRDIRSVSSSRGVRVETLSDTGEDGDTVPGH